MKDRKDFQKLFDQIGFELQDMNVLNEAFTHRSAVNEYSNVHRHNERLEFLGDAVLELIATDFLFRTFDKPEGDLTNYRSALVKGDHLAQVARRLGIGKLLVMSKGETKSGGAEKDYILANTVEAFIGAIYLEKGIAGSTDFIHRFILCDLEKILLEGEYIDSKSEFQELSQGSIGITPHYEVFSESGLDHDKTFVVDAYLNDKRVGRGTGRSKKEAQLFAAADALQKKNQWLKKL